MKGLISNHTSFLDAIVTVLAIPSTVRPLGKIELKKFPLLGIVIGIFGVFVDRKNAESRKKSVQNMKKVIENGDNILIFPEGTMNRTDKKLQDFYDGAFRIAKETGIEIVPLVINGANRLLPPSKFYLMPGKVSVEVGAPVNTNSYSMEELKSFCYQWIYDRVEK